VRRLRNGLLVAVLLVATLGVVCLTTIDNQPFFRTPAYQTTLSSWQEKATNLAIPLGRLQAGFGRALLSPTLNAEMDDPAQGRFRTLPLAGYGNRKGQPATGIHDDVWVKAVAFAVENRVGVMVSADALIIPREVALLASDRIRKETGLQRDQIYFGATHTHASLGAWGEGIIAEAFAGKYQAGARVWFSDRLVTAVKAALADLRPAAAGQGKVALPQYARNRLVGTLGRIDPELTFLVVKQEGGATGVIGSYSAHSTVLSSQVMEFSGDYPGQWQRAVEKAVGGTALFFLGGAGSHSPVAGAPGYQGVQAMGDALAAQAVARLPDLAMTNRVQFGIAGVDLCLPEPHVRVTDTLRLRPWLAKRLLPTGPSAFVQVMRLGEWVWIATPCDFSGEMALEIKDFARARGLQATVTSFNGDYIGYVIPHRYYHLGGYEPRVMSFFGPTVPDYMDDLIRRMFVDLAQGAGTPGDYRR
jgi:neutral ceramidase